MSLPSDVTPDVADAVDRLSSAAARAKSATARAKSNLTNEQIGLAAAAIAAFLGIAYFGPLLSRLSRPKPLRARAARRARDAKNRVWAFGQSARASGRKARKTVKRLGGGPIWR